MNIPAFLYFFNLLWASPSVIFSRELQKTAQFKVHSLPGISSLPSSWAGRLPVPGTKNGNDIFFWLFESEKTAYDGNLISEFYCESIWKECGGLLTFYSLVQWWSWMFILDRASNGQWSLFVRRQLNQPRPQSTLVDTFGQCALC